MSGKNFDIFISYRRSDGDEIAAKINETLKGNHYRCFFDFESLKDGRFDERIERAIEDAPVFIALLTPHYLERPKEEKEKESEDEEKKNDEEDWVIREIECAIKNNKKIIPIDYNKKFVEYPESLSEEIKKGLGGHNFAVVSSGQQYSRDMDALMEDWIGNTVPKPTQRTQGKANIEVSSDVNCDILKAGEVIATVAKGGYNILKLPQGRHKLICRSNDFLDVQQKIVLEIDQDLADDFIEIELANEVQPLIEEKRRKEEEEQRLREEEERRRKAEAERLERIRQLGNKKNVKKYLAYIACSHKDMDAAKKLKNFIENFKIPEELSERYNLPKTMPPIFFDVDSLDGGCLVSQIEEVLMQSRYLIVVCSPNSARSTYINEEIEFFISLGGDNRILPYIIDGKPIPDEGHDWCYPPALNRNQLEHEIVGADVREAGFKIAALRIISAMLGVDFLTLYAQFIKNQKRKRSLF